MHFLLLMAALAAEPTAAPPDPNAKPASPIVQPHWLRLPPPEAFARYYPEAASRQGIEGRATFSCVVNAGGTLDACQVVAEEPPGAGFGEAALRLAPLFKMKPPKGPDGELSAGGIVRIPVRFALPKPVPPELPPLPEGSLNARELKWVVKPEGRDFARVFPREAQRRGIEGVAVIQCVVDDKGNLRPCAVIGEDPAGQGFGSAALALSRLFGTTAQAPDGTPTVGRPIRIPIRFNLPRS